MLDCSFVSNSFRRHLDIQVSGSVRHSCNQTRIDNAFIPCQSLERIAVLVVNRLKIESIDDLSFAHRNSFLQWHNKSKSKWRIIAQQFVNSDISLQSGIEANIQTNKLLHSPTDSMINCKKWQIICIKLTFVVFFFAHTIVCEHYCTHSNLSWAGIGIPQMRMIVFIIVVK